MASTAQVDIYTLFDGNIDMYQRRGSPQSEILGDAWPTIEDLRQRLFLVATGRASVAFANSVEAVILAWTVEDARCRIRRMVESHVAKEHKA